MNPSQKTYHVHHELIVYGSRHHTPIATYAVEAVSAAAALQAFGAYYRLTSDSERLRVVAAGGAA